jgi:YhcH/YjgK/YiaL family protein
MIIDRISHAGNYAGLGDRIKAGLDWLASTDLPAMEPGRYELDGSNLYVLIQANETKTRDSGKWEAHRRYIDIQYLFAGHEQIGYAPVETLRPEGSFDEDRDFQLLQGTGDYLTLETGTFMILYPQDAHMPGLAISQPQLARKAVVKVRIG